MSVTVFFMVKFINLFFVDLPPPSVGPPPTQEQQGSLPLYLPLSLPLPIALPLPSPPILHSLLQYAHYPSFLAPSFPQLSTPLFKFL